MVYVEGRDGAGSRGHVLYLGLAVGIGIGNARIA